jgi:RHS repeat-associated protein
MMLTCYLVSGCTNGAAARYYRYDAYGQPRAYDASGALLSSLGAALLNGYVPERLYTGQRWDWQAQLYDYGARFYDPKLANFLTEDPARDGVNPYAYVNWNPVRFTDPTGMYSLQVLNYIMARFNAYGQDTGRLAEMSAIGAGLAAFHGAGTGGAATVLGAASLGETVSTAIAVATAQAIQAIAEQQGGNMTAAYPVLNASVPGGVALADQGVRAGTPTVFGSPPAGGAGVAGSAPGQAGSVSPGYVDINGTAGFFVGRTVGATGGLQLADKGFFVYLGPALTTPGGSVAFTYSPDTASSGIAVGLQATYYLSFQAGYSFGSSPGRFFEFGVGGPPGLSLSAYYAFGPFSYSVLNGTFFERR